MEVKFTRQSIIIVNTVNKNQYGDLEWTDKEGNSYKIPVKRAIHFEKIIVPDMAVQLNYAMSAFGREYIYSAIQVKDNLPPAQPIPPPTARELPPKPSQVVPAATEPPRKPLIEAAKQIGGVEIEKPRINDPTRIKDRAVALSYAKDIAVAEINAGVPFDGKAWDKMIDRANFILKYMEGRD